MITAKNYSAQAESGLEWFSNYLNKCGHYEDAESVKAISRTINESVKFCIEDNGRIFNDGLKALKGSRINLPFKKICIEYFQENISGQEFTRISEGHTIERISKVVLICADIDAVWTDMPIEYSDSIIISMALFYNSDRRWQLAESGLLVKKDFFITGVGLYHYSPIPRYSSHCNNIFATTQEETFYTSMPYLKAFFEFLEALSCKNVEQSIYQPASPKNVQRIKSNKLPIYETKFLTIKAGALKDSGKSGVIGSHASPRQHLRRGHIRRLESGNIWVNSCVVGDGTIGKIDKDYRVNTDY